MQTTRTTFGTVRRSDGGTSVYAEGDTLRDWANRGDNRWPCSLLARLGSIEVGFDSRGDLVEIVADGDTDDLSAEELNAWTSEALIRAGYPNHPAIR